MINLSIFFRALEIKDEPQHQLREMQPLERAMVVLCMLSFCPHQAIQSCSSNPDYLLCITGLETGQKYASANYYYRTRKG